MKSRTSLIGSCLIGSLMLTCLIVILAGGLMLGAEQRAERKGDEEARRDRHVEAEARTLDAQIAGEPPERAETGERRAEGEP